MEKLVKTYHASGKTMEPVVYPTEHKMETSKRVTYNAEVTKFYDRREAIRIMVRDLTDEKLFKLLRDIIGKDGE